MPLSSKRQGVLQLATSLHKTLLRGDSEASLGLSRTCKTSRIETMTLSCAQEGAKGKAGRGTYIICCQCPSPG